MMFTMIGHCTKCGAPVYSDSVWNGTSPPPVRYSCLCQDDGRRFVNSFTATNGVSVNLRDPEYLPTKDHDHIQAIKARLGSISPGRLIQIQELSPAAHRILTQDLPYLLGD